MLFLKYVVYAFCFLVFSFTISVLVGIFVRRMMSADENFTEAWRISQSKAERSKAPKAEVRKAGSLR